MGIQSNPSQVLKQCVVLEFRRQLLLNALYGWRACQVECAEAPKELKDNFSIPRSFRKSVRVFKSQVWSRADTNLN